MKLLAGVDKDSSLINSVVAPAANLHVLMPAADLLHGDEQIVYGETG